LLLKQQERGIRRERRVALNQQVKDATGGCARTQFGNGALDGCLMRSARAGHRHEVGNEVRATPQLNIHQ
jgi:hypothetical protein